MYRSGSQRQHFPAGEVNSGDTVTALYEVTVRRHGVPLGSVRLRYREPGSNRVVEREFSVTPGRFAPSFAAATNGYRVAVVAARFAELLRGGPAKSAELDELAGVADSIRRAGREARELADLVARAARLAHDERRESQRRRTRRPD